MGPRMFQALQAGSPACSRDMGALPDGRMLRVASRPVQVAVPALVLVLCSSIPAWGQYASIRDISLKPWTGFARYWDWAYDGMHKLVLSGITGPVVLNTKPMSRREMALILADVIRRIQENRVPEFNHRTDLNELLLELMDEFSPELLALGVDAYGIRGERPRFLEVKPVEFLQLRGGYTSNAPTILENSDGERLEQGVNGRVAATSWLTAGGHFAAYVNPEFQFGQGYASGRLVEAYVKGRLGSFELVVGRESLWWGPGFHGSMLISNNPLGLDMIRLQTAEQITLPWVFRYLGPMKVTVLFGQFEEERDFPRTKLSGFRFDLAPATWLELGLSRTGMFNGEGRPSPKWYQYPLTLVISEDDLNSIYNENNLFQFDVTVRLANIGKYIHLTRDAEVYLDFGWDDTCCETAYIPLKPGFTVGLYLPNLFRSPDTTFRVEYTNTSSFNFTHGIYTDGYVRKGFVLSHFVGTGGEDLFFLLTQRLDKRLMVGMELDFAQRGRTTAGLVFATKEQRSHFGVEVSYQHSKNLTLNAGFRLEWVNNRDFIPGNDDFNQVYTVSVTYAFEKSYGAGKRE